MTKKASGTLTVGNILRVAAVRYRGREAIFWWRGSLPSTPTGKIAQFLLVEKFSQR